MNPNTNLYMKNLHLSLILHQNCAFVPVGVEVNVVAAAAAAVAAHIYLRYFQQLASCILK